MQHHDSSQPSCASTEQSGGYGLLLVSKTESCPVSSNAISGGYFADVSCLNLRYYVADWNEQCALLLAIWSKRPAGRHEPLLVPSETVALMLYQQIRQNKTRCPGTVACRTAHGNPQSGGLMTTTRCRGGLFCCVHLQSATLNLEEEKAPASACVRSSHIDEA